MLLGVDPSRIVEVPSETLKIDDWRRIVWIRFFSMYSIWLTKPEKVKDEGNQRNSVSVNTKWTLNIADSVLVAVTKLRYVNFVNDFPFVPMQLFLRWTTRTRPNQKNGSNQKQNNDEQVKNGDDHPHSFPFFALNVFFELLKENRKIFSFFLTLRNEQFSRFLRFFFYLTKINKIVENNLIQVFYPGNQEWLATEK